ncbi:MAG TPA: FHA domain-containing protein, partial [Planctomycetaceae bacterium]|nr:FHA domain-containing protein [Planctomycetaceae bacterium]
MSLLVVKTPDGSVRQFPLSKSQPLTIGRNDTCDVVIDEESVAQVEARLSWNKSQYELTAANPAGVTVNGNTMSRSNLKSGDTILIGNFDLLFTTPEDYQNLGGGLTQDSNEIGLTPLTDEIPVYRSSSPATPEKKPSGPVPRPPEPKAAAPESPISDKVLKRKTAPVSSSDPKPASKPADSKSPLKRVKYGEEAPSGGIEDYDGGTGKGSAKKAALQAEEEGESVLDKIRGQLYASRQRPGEQELKRSPLVVMLSILGVILAITGIVFWSAIGHEEASLYLERARASASERKFSQAIEDYETFLVQFPNNDAYEDARVELSKVRVESQIDIGVPDWKNGFLQLEKMIERHRDDENFATLKPVLGEYARKIAIGTSQTAEREYDSSYFEIGQQALALVDRYITEPAQLELVHAEIKDARRKAEATILKHATQEGAFSKIKAAIEKKQPMAVIQARRELLQRYPDMESNAEIRKSLVTALEIEKSLIVKFDEQQAASPPHQLPAGSVYSMTSKVPAETGLPSDRAVFIHAADTLYGVDSSTGIPMWRRPVGFDLPFFPEEVETSTSALLVANTRRDALELLERNTGKPLWSQQCEAGVTGLPLIKGNQAFLLIRNGELWQLDLQTGEIQERLKFPRPVSSAPAFMTEKEETLVVVGDLEVAYQIGLQPLTIEQVVFLGHGPGSIVAPLLRMGPFVLFAENDRANSCRLRVLDSRNSENRLKQVAETRIPGNVTDRPMIRGRQLFVPANPEQVFALTVSAEDGQPPIVPVGSYQVSNGRNTPVYLFTGPDGLLWMGSSGLRKLELGTDSLTADTNTAAPGLATQPLQMIGERIFAARRPPYGRSVRFSRLDRNTFQASWLTSLGGSVQETTTNSAGELICLLESGDVFRI